MKESLRRVILFAVIVITGSIMILVDIPLIIMVPLILAIGFVVLLLLGAITVAEIKSVFTRANAKNPKKTGILKRLNEMKFFEKKAIQPDNKQASPVKKEEPQKTKPINTGAGLHLRTFLSSLGSLGTILKQRSKREKKVEHINELLDKTVSEKVKSSALTSAGNGVNTRTPPPAGSGGPGTQEQPKGQDPFLSLSDDEFDVSLLDGLDDLEAPLPKSSPGQELSPIVPNSGSDMAIGDPDIPVPSLDISSEADDILKDNEGGREEFKDLEGGESIDQDFGDLDSLNLDDVDLDIDMEDETTAGAESPSPKAEKPAGASPAGSSTTPSTTTVKTDWVQSDAPKSTTEAEDQISTQADMASFAGGASGSDEDMLSSLASDVKHVTKEKNISLLRDLKDFKAPATDIENELKEMYETMKSVSDPRKKVIVPAKKKK